MKLYIQRHAIAEDWDEHAYPDDSIRPLTAKGIKKMAKIAKHMKDMGIQGDLILTSPYTRAHQTARIVAEVHDLKKKQLVGSDHLKPSGSANKLIAVINEKYPVENIMLVGHEPYLSGLIAMLLAGALSLSITLKKGGLCCLSTETLLYEKCATLEWLLTPAQLIRMGK